jgi:hypothetical protein
MRNVSLIIGAFLGTLLFSGCANTSSVREYGERADLGHGFYVTELDLKLPTDNQGGTYKSLVMCYNDFALDRVINTNGLIFKQGRFAVISGLKYGVSVFDSKKSVLYKIDQIPGLIVSSELTKDEKGIIVQYSDKAGVKHVLTIAINTLEMFPDFLPMPLNLDTEEEPKKTKGKDI